MDCCEKEAFAATSLQPFLVLYEQTRMDTESAEQKCKCRYVDIGVRQRLARDMCNVCVEGVIPAWQNELVSSNMASSITLLFVDDEALTTNYEEGPERVDKI